MSKERSAESWWDDDKVSARERGLLRMCSVRWQDLQTIIFP